MHDICVHAPSPSRIHGDYCSVCERVIDDITVRGINCCQPHVHPIKTMAEASFGEVLVEVATQHTHLSQQRTSVNF